MIPFMYDELSDISKRLILLIYKKDKIKEVKTISKAMKEDWLNNKKNQMEEFLINIGAAAKDELSKSNVSTEKKRKIREECKLFVVNLLSKVPIQYALIRDSSSLSPINMVNQASLMSTRFDRLADLLYSLKFISSFVADNAKFQYQQFISKDVINNKDEFLSFDMKEQRVDTFLGEYLSVNSQFKRVVEHL